MSRRITGHEVNDFNRRLHIVARDEKGPGGAHHFYEITTLPSLKDMRYEGADALGKVHEVIFQKGTVPISGVNGITEEALLSILIDRLQCFQEGPFACDENSRALDSLEMALLHLNERTLNRLTRGVEGTHTP